MSVVEYPHPVLFPDGNDYNDDCVFTLDLPEAAQMVDGNDLLLTVEYHLSCNGIEKYIVDGSAAVGVIVHSSATSFRRAWFFSTESTKKEIRINKYAVAKSLTVQCMIIATKDISTFALNEFNQLFFSNISFRLVKGDVLAMTEKTTLYLDSSELEKPLSSIFLINDKESQEEPVLPDFDDETGKIAINVSGRLFNDYKSIEDGYANTAQRCITCSLVLPVLVEAISVLRSDPDYYGEKRWARVIDHKLKDRSIDVLNDQHGCAELANLLLGDVIGGSLDSLRTILQAETEWDDVSGGYD